MAAADNIKVKIEVNASDLVEACIKALTEDGTLAEVVRCVDCKHSESWYSDHRRCFLWCETGIGVWDDGYCSYGERSEDETN